MSTERDQSVAYVALSRTARRMLRVIEREVARTGTSAAKITTDVFERAGCRREHQPAARAELVAGGFVVVSTNSHRAMVFTSLSATPPPVHTDERRHDDDAGGERHRGVRQTTVTLAKIDWPSPKWRDVL